MEERDYARNLYKFVGCVFVNTYLLHLALSSSKIYIEVAGWPDLYIF